LRAGPVAAATCAAALADATALASQGVRRVLTDLTGSEPAAETVAAIEQDLVRGRHVLRYAAEDDFGLPESEFLVCRFWLIDALCLLGRGEEARARFKDALALRNHYGLFSEDIDPKTGTLWGNFPQTYSMAGLILSAMRLSKSWEERYWHASS